MRDQAHENAFAKALGSLGVNSGSVFAPERKEEFSPGLDKDLLALIQATAEVELGKADAPGTHS